MQASLVFCIIVSRALTSALAPEEGQQDRQQLTKPKQEPLKGIAMNIDWNHWSLQKSGQAAED